MRIQLLWHSGKGVEKVMKGKFSYLEKIASIDPAVASGSGARAAQNIAGIVA
jgi:hypothetical protein